MTFKEIQELIRFFNKSELSELKIEQEGFKISIKSAAAATQPQVIYSGIPQQTVNTAQPVTQVQNSSSATTSIENSNSTSEEKSVVETTSGTPFKSPMIGTFYRSAGPDKPPFVKVGDVVKKGDILCIVEAMKLFNEIESEMSGTIVKVLVDDASPVEYDQPLFIIAP